MDGEGVKPAFAGCPQVTGADLDGETLVVRFSDGTNTVESVRDCGFSRKCALLAGIVRRTFATSISRETGEASAEGLDEAVSRLLRSVSRVSAPKRTSRISRLLASQGA